MKWLGVATFAAKPGGSVIAYCAGRYALSLVSAITLGSAFAQDSSKMRKPPTSISGNFSKACPPGHRIEFVVGSLSLFVDPSWLDTASLAPLSERFGSNCPSRPVTISSLYFSKPILDAANIPAKLGQPFLFFVIRNKAEFPLGRMTKLGLSDAPPLRQTAEPYIEDVTRIAFPAIPGLPIRAHSPSKRAYRLVYPGFGHEPPTSIEIMCGGDPSQPGQPGPGRTCFTPIAYSYLGEISVRYEFRQDHLPIISPGQAASPSAMSEPDGVLVFDTHIRVWLDRLTRNP
jgi:hypothetical protein